jgi:hypothetical protein
LHALKNETHVEFHGKVIPIFADFDPQALGIQPLFNGYRPAFLREKESLDFIIKSALTQEIVLQDHERDMVYRGFDNTAKAALNHFDPAYRAAARKIDVIIKRYGNISRKTFDDESAAIDDLIQELQLPANESDVTLIGLKPWKDRLAYENTRFRQLMDERYNETAGKTSLRMKTARTETDKYYLAILSQIENNHLAGIPVNEAFLKKLNTVIERFGHILAQEIGERKPKPAPNETED